MKCNSVSEVPQSSVAWARKQTHTSADLCVKPQQAFFRRRGRQGVDDCEPTATLWANTGDQHSDAAWKLAINNSSRTAVQTGPRVVMKLYIGVISLRHLRKTGCALKAEGWIVRFSSSVIHPRSHQDKLRRVVLRHGLNWLTFSWRKPFVLCDLQVKDFIPVTQTHKIPFGELLSVICIVVSLTQCLRMLNIVSSIDLQHEFKCCICKKKNKTKTKRWLKEGRNYMIHSADWKQLLDSMAAW